MSSHPHTAPGQRASCNSCNAPVRWLAHERTRRLAPIDAEPDPVKGNISIDLAAGTYRVLGVYERGAAIAQNETLYTNHFLHYPQAHAWAKTGKPRKPYTRKEPTHAD